MSRMNIVECEQPTQQTYAILAEGETGKSQTAFASFALVLSPASQFAFHAVGKLSGLSLRSQLARTERSQYTRNHANLLTLWLLNFSKTEATGEDVQLSQLNKDLDDE